MSIYSKWCITYRNGKLTSIGVFQKWVNFKEYPLTNIRECSAMMLPSKGEWDDCSQKCWSSMALERVVVRTQLRTERRGLAKFAQWECGWDGAGAQGCIQVSSATGTGTFAGDMRQMSGANGYYWKWRYRVAWGGQGWVISRWAGSLRPETTGHPILPSRINL